jgi:hypothetical protein
LLGAVARKVGEAADRWQAAKRGVDAVHVVDIPEPLVGLLQRLGLVLGCSGDD